MGRLCGHIVAPMQAASRSRKRLALHTTASPRRLPAVVPPRRQRRFDFPHVLDDAEDGHCIPCVAWDAKELCRDLQFTLSQPSMVASSPHGWSSRIPRPNFPTRPVATRPFGCPGRVLAFSLSVPRHHASTLPSALVGRPSFGRRWSPVIWATAIAPKATKGAAPGKDGKWEIVGMALGPI